MKPSDYQKLRSMLDDALASDDPAMTKYHVRAAAQHLEVMRSRDGRAATECDD